MAAAVRAKQHGNPQALIVGWLAVYHAATPGANLADNTTVRLDLDNELQPDALLRIEPEVGGRSRITEDDYIEAAPELIVEVAASSASYDLNDKLNVYRRNGVKQYVVWQIYENEIVWYRLEDSEYILAQPDAEGLIYSRVFPGLSLDVNARQNRDLASVSHSEYRNGEISPMTGGTPEHNKIASALNALLWFGLRGEIAS